MRLFVWNGYWMGLGRQVVAPVVCALRGHRLRRTVKGYWTGPIRKYLADAAIIRGHQCVRCWRGFKHAAG